MTSPRPPILINPSARTITTPSAIRCPGPNVLDADIRGLKAVGYTFLLALCGCLAGWAFMVWVS